MNEPAQLKSSPSPATAVSIIETDTTASPTLTTTATAVSASPTNTLPPTTTTTQPNIILLMSDDQGWAETGYYNHRIAQTPNLDAMAQSGLQLDRFYATAPICTPTRVSVLTGRHHYRSGCFDVKDCTLDQQETTIAEMLQEAGYATGHFGKWHVGLLRGPNISTPGDNGFAQWVSAFLFFDLNADSFQENGQPLSAISGDGSDFIMSEALQFIEQSVNQEQPFFAVIWYAAPHMPWEALEADRALFSGSSEDEQNYFGELYAMDRSIGVLRQQLRELGVADNTILWFNSDNGPHRRLGSEATGGLRGYKSSLWEGGIRVPAVIEWPARILQASVTAVPVSTLDIFPTLLAAAGISYESTAPLDGINLLPLMDGTMTTRDNPIPFWYEPEIDALPSSNIGHAVWLLDPYKLHKIVDEAGNATFQLYNIVDDPTESTDLAETHPDILSQMITALEAWQEDVWLDLEE